MFAPEPTAMQMMPQPLLYAATIQLPTTAVVASIAYLLKSGGQYTEAQRRAEHGPCLGVGRLEVSLEAGSKAPLIGHGQGGTVAHAAT